MFVAYYLCIYTPIVFPVGDDDENKYPVISSSIRPAKADKQLPRIAIPRRSLLSAYLAFLCFFRFDRSSRTILR
jgi:hypothetical protein